MLCDVVTPRRTRRTRLDDEGVARPTPRETTVTHSQSHRISLDTPASRRCRSISHHPDVAVVDVDTSLLLLLLLL